MNYGEQISKTHWANKAELDAHRKSLGLSYTLTLEDKIRDAYRAYSNFCYSVGVKPKTIIDFLKTKVI